VAPASPAEPVVRATPGAGIPATPRDNGPTQRWGRLRQCDPEVPGPRPPRPLAGPPEQGHPRGKGRVGGGSRGPSAKPSLDSARPTLARAWCTAGARWPSQGRSEAPDAWLRGTRASPTPLAADPYLAADEDRSAVARRRSHSGRPPGSPLRNLAVSRETGDGEGTDARESARAEACR